MSRNFMSYVFLYPLLRKNQHHLQLIYDSFGNKENKFHYQLFTPYLYLKRNQIIQNQYYLYHSIPLLYFYKYHSFSEIPFYISPTDLSIKPKMIEKNEYKETNKTDENDIHSEKYVFYYI